MKFIKIVTIAFAVLSLFSCTKHKIKFDIEEVDPTTATEFQLHYFEPITNTSANYIDSVFVNDVLYSSVNGSGQLATYNGIPGGSVARFFTVKAGNTNFKLWRKGNLIYDKDVNLPVGKVNIFIYDMTKDPVVLDNLEDQLRAHAPYNGEVYGTDSVATVRFFNFMFEDATTPYPGKLQYQWKNAQMTEYANLGAPVAFGEATDRIPVTFRKTVFNSSGYCRIDYRILDENGNILQYYNGSRMTNYSDWWTAYIGRAYCHIWSGVRTQKPTAAVRVWTSL